jgi:DNA ligase-1
MLAQAANNVEEAITATGLPARVDAKVDGIRVQVHRDGDDVGVFSRSLDDITARVPELVAAVRELPSRSIVLDGEALAVDQAGRARPFQEGAGEGAGESAGADTGEGALEGREKEKGPPAVFDASGPAITRRCETLP